MNSIWSAVIALFIILISVVTIQNRRSVAGGINRSRDEALSPCPTSPNCVSTYRNSGYASLKPMQYEGISRNKAREVLHSVLESWPRCEIVTIEDDYVHAVLWSKLFRFRDDVEFHLPESESQVYFRAASRVGYDDLGVHRKRMHTMTVEFENAALRAAEEHAGSK